MTVSYKITNRNDIDPPGKQITYYIVETEEIVGTRTVYIEADSNIENNQDIIASAEAQLPQFQANPYWLMGTSQP